MPETLLELRSVTQDLSRRHGARRREPFAPPGRGAGADRRERRRQVDADEDPRRRGRADLRRRSCSTASRTISLTVSRGDGGRASPSSTRSSTSSRTSSVAANVFIGREPRCGGPLQPDRHARAATRASRRSSSGSALDFAPPTRSRTLSIAQRQMVEIAKALSLDARVIIMDEPTSSLTLTETDAPARGDRGPARGRRQHHLHLAPAGRGEDLRRPRRRRCATAGASAS